MSINRELKHTFKSVSKLYNQVRPSYPKELVDAIIKFADLKSDAKILDIGCGNGQATKLFAERGYPVLGIDLHEEQIELARENTKEFTNVEYQAISFEDFVAPDKSFDLIISAQAFHWIPSETGYPKAYQLLKAGGALAVFWNLTHYSDSDSQWLKKLQELYKERCPDRPKKFITAVVDDVLASAKFFPVERKTLAHQISYTKEQYKDLIRTMSWMISLPETTQNDILKEMDKILAPESEPLAITYTIELFLAKK